MKASKTAITRLKSSEEIAVCREIFSKSEPWITLRMNKTYFEQILSDSLNETYLLKVEGEIAGVIILQMQGPFPGYVKSIVIDGKWEGKGYGRILLEYAEERIFKDSPNVFLCVSSFNSKAQFFYQKMGYQQVGKLKDYLINGQSELLLRKTHGPVMGYK